MASNNYDDRHELCKLLLDCLCIKDPESRKTVLDQLPTYITHSYKRSSIDRDDVFNITLACLNYPNGLSALVEVIHGMEDNSIPFLALQKFVQKKLVTPQRLKTEQTQDLVNLISGNIPSDQIRKLYRACHPQDGEIPVVENEEARLAWMLDELADFPVQQDGTVPLLKFVKQLVTHVSDAQRRNQVQEWGRKAALRLGVDPSVMDIAKVDAAPRVGTQHAPLFLLVKIEPDESDRKMFIVQAWCRLSDPNSVRPLETGDRPYLEGQLPEVLTALLIQIADDIADAADDLHIEIFLPHTLLHLSIEEWDLNFGDGMPLPVGVKYPVIARSLERTRLKLLWGAWRRRWQNLPKHAARFEEASIHWICDEKDTNERKLYGRLSQEESLCLVLTMTPLRLAKGNYMQIIFFTANKAGTPVALWLRRIEQFSVEQRQALENLLRNTLPADLPNILHKARHHAWSEEEETLLGSGVTLLWEDPEHLPPDATVQFATPIIGGER